MVAISACNTIKKKRKFANFVRLYFPRITTFSILVFYYFLKVLSGSFMYLKIITLVHHIPTRAQLIGNLSKQNGNVTAVNTIVLFNIIPYNSKYCRKEMNNSNPMGALHVVVALFTTQNHRFLRLVHNACPLKPRQVLH